MADEKIQIKIELEKAIADVANLDAKLLKLNETLKLTTKDTEEYNKVQEEIAETSKDAANASVELSIANAKAAQNVAQLNKAMKDLKSAQEKVDKSSPTFAKLNKAINETEDRIGNLGDSMETLVGTGAERLKASMNLLKDSFSNLDPGKAMTALKGIGAAFKTAGGPIFLLIGAIGLIIENFDKLKNAGGIVGKIFQGIANIIGDVVQVFKDFSDAILGTSFAAEEASEKTIKAAKKQQEVLTDRYDKEIALASAAGKNTLKLEKQKQIAILKTLDVQIKAIMAAAKANGHYTEEQMKQIEEIGKAAAEATQALKLAEVKDIKEKSDANKKAGEDKLKDEEKLRQQIADEQINAIKDEEERAKAKAELDKQRRDKDINDSKASIKTKNEALKASELQLSTELAKIQSDAADKANAEIDKEEAKEKERKAKELSTLINHLKNQAQIRLNDSKKTIKDRQAFLDEMFIADIKAAGNDADAKRLIEQKYAADSLALVKETEKAKRDEQKQTFAMAQQVANDTIQVITQINDLQNQTRDQDLAAYNAAQEEKLDTLSSAKESELANENLTSDEKVAIQNKYAQEEYQIKLAQYNQNMEIKKKEFENGKKLAIASALIAGAVAAVNALSAAPFFPMAIIGLAMATITTALSVAKISSQKFDGGGSPPKPPSIASAASSAGVGSGAKNNEKFLPPNLKRVGSGGNAEFNDPNAPQSKRTSGGDKEPIKAYVVSQEVTSAQNKSAVIERRRSF